jgi:hypothetical protein
MLAPVSPCFPRAPPQSAGTWCDQSLVYEDSSKKGRAYLQFTFGVYGQITSLASLALVSQAPNRVLRAMLMVSIRDEMRDGSCSNLAESASCWDGESGGLELVRLLTTFVTCKQ